MINKNPDTAYQIFWTKKFQNNYYDKLIDTNVSKVAEKILKEEQQEEEREKSFVYVLEDYQREKYQRRRMAKKLQNMRARTLAELKIFKR